MTAAIGQVQNERGHAAGGRHAAHRKRRWAADRLAEAVARAHVNVVGRQRALELLQRAGAH